MSSPISNSNKPPIPPSPTPKPPPRAAPPPPPKPQAAPAPSDTFQKRAPASSTEVRLGGAPTTVQQGINASDGLNCLEASTLHAQAHPPQQVLLLKDTSADNATEAATGARTNHAVAVQGGMVTFDGTQELKPPVPVATYLATNGYEQFRNPQGNLVGPVSPMLLTDSTLRTRALAPGGALEGVSGTFADPPLPRPPPLDQATVTATLGVDPVSLGIDPAALQNQIELSNARTSLGQAQQALASLPSTATQAQRDVAQAAVNQAQATVTRLEQVEAALPADQVEKARLPVLTARMAQLETQYANMPGYAVQIARQTFYNGGMYTGTSGAAAIPDWMINMTGLPHGARHPDGNGGYLGEMRAPNGQQIDLGHVLCALDYNAPQPRVGSSETKDRNLHTYGGSILPNPSNHGGMVTLAGDLGTAANTYLTNGNDASAALRNEGQSDLRGDVDGLNLSTLLGRGGWSGATPVASALTNYYFGSGPETSTNRAQFFMDNSQYVFHNPETGQYLIKPELFGDVNNVATVFGLFGGRFNGLDGTQAVVQAFAQWLDQERQGRNPLA